MKRVKRSDTKPEVTLRKALHRLGFRYVIGDKRLPGTPDLVLPKHKAVVFVHGCFWHGHECRQGRTPSSNVNYWAPKIAANRARDARKVKALLHLGWRVFTVWECELKQAVALDTAKQLASQINNQSNGPSTRCRDAQHS
ncbi:MAG: DNA mismatch endonuclease Vsr [Rhodanobacteraceae bacterium]|jgi:DNA mismatch endonuclease (patch repair protein)|nr:DNA mismatch endonuclease Vsr [Rhodanobacteraceae bacterium]